MLGKPNNLELLLYQAFDRARVCSSYPLQIGSVLPLCVPKVSQMGFRRKDVGGERNKQGVLNIQEILIMKIFNRRKNFSSNCDDGKYTYNKA